MSLRQRVQEIVEGNGIVRPTGPKIWDGRIHKNYFRMDGDFCVRCGLKLIDEFFWLELSNAGRGFKDPLVSRFPEEESRGLFPFGENCARKTLEEQKARTA